MQVDKGHPIKSKCFILVNFHVFSGHFLNLKRLLSEKS
jgi:hypothetical protein